MAGPATFIFISGGVRSGKSTFAEKLAAEIAVKARGKLHYIAAGQASDKEMKERIERHQKGRLESKLGWKTWEQHRNLGEIAESFSAGDVVLLDCLTTLLNNEFFLEGEKWEDPDFQKRIIMSITEGVDQIKNRCHTLILVSNEVLNEPVGRSELVFTYGKILGRLHQLMVKKANRAFLVEAGIPKSMKGGGQA